MTAAAGEPATSSTDCGLAETLIAARAAGSLGPEAAPRLDDHLARCAACMQVVRELDSIVGSLAGTMHACGGEPLEVIAPDHYVRGIEIGRGGMGHIVRAYDRRLGRTVAIKQLLDPRLAARFEREARLTARLQHPAIVPIYEAGRWPSGEPFYAMKYVDGRPLDAAIASLPTLGGRLTLLANLTTAVEAVAYAHSEGIVHRDLKPQNILVGAFGETVVIDWGLAKDLRSPPSEDEGGEPELAFTLDGAGTPAYMAPEQARGEPPDERIDVYSLGATLHHLLAGGRPGDLPLPDETPADLRAIVVRAMAGEPGTRYPTAAELAGDLRRFQAGQLVASHHYTADELVRRWLRRHRGIAIVTVAALAIVAGGGAWSVSRILAERDRASRAAAAALEQRTAAETQRNGAEHLVDFMLGALHDRLARVGRLELLEGIGQQVGNYLASAPQARDTDPGVVVQRARALRQLGAVDLQRGHFAQAAGEYDQARQLCARLQRISSTRESAACVAAALCQLAGIESYRGNTEAALAGWNDERAVLDAALQRDPDDPELRRLRGELSAYIARELTKQGHYARARAAFGEAIALDAALVAQRPSDLESMSQLALAHGGLCMLEIADGHPADAIRHCQRTVDVRDQQRALEPDSFEWESGSASAMVRVADAALAMGDAGRARDSLAPALAVLRRRFAADPSNTLWQTQLASALWMHGTSEIEIGHPEDGERACREAAAAFEAVLRNQPDHQATAMNLLGVDTTLALAEARQHQLVAARAAAARAVQLADTWLHERRSFEWLIGVSEAQHAAAMVARAEHRLADARSAAAAALDAATAATSPQPRPEHDQALARAELLIADLDADAGDRKAAEPRLRSALARLEVATGRWPQLIELQERRALSAVRLAELTRDPGEAQGLRARARQILDPLVQRRALEVEFRSLPRRARQSGAASHAR